MSRAYPHACGPLHMNSSGLSLSSSASLQGRPVPGLSYMRHMPPSARRRSQLCTVDGFSPSAVPISPTLLPSFLSMAACTRSRGFPQGSRSRMRLRSPMSVLGRYPAPLLTFTAFGMGGSGAWG